MTGHPAISLWEATAEEAAGSDVFAPGEQVDLAIVGGGYTGLSCALHAAERGLSVRVLEAERVGFGGSGRNAGLVNAAAWLPPAKVRAALGPVFGPRFLERFGAGPRVVFELIERHQIRCEAVRNGTIHAAHAPAGLEDLRARHAEWQRLGEPVELLDARAVAGLTGTGAFCGGLLDHRAGTINPMGYARGLARAARAAGARVTEGARVEALSRDGGRWRLRTGAGAVLARSVVLGTNAYTDGLWPGLSREVFHIHYLQLATEPLGAAGEHVLPGGQGLWDTGRVMFHVRRDTAGRLIVGTMGRLIGSRERGLTRRWAERQIARVFPGLGRPAIEQAWDGRIAMTPDHLPRVLRLGDGLWTPIGYNGRGIATGTLFGQAMAGLAAGEDPGELPLPVSAPRPVRAGALRAAAAGLAFGASQLWRSLA